MGSVVTIEHNVIINHTPSYFFVILPNKDGVPRICWYMEQDVILSH